MQLKAPTRPAGVLGHARSAGTDGAAVPHNAAPAEPYEYSAPEAVGLELYLMVRGRGMPIETPAVRP